MDDREDGRRLVGSVPLGCLHGESPAPRGDAAVIENAPSSMMADPCRRDTGWSTPCYGRRSAVLKPPEECVALRPQCLAAAVAEAHARHATERDRALPPATRAGSFRRRRRHPPRGQVPARTSGLVPRRRRRPCRSLDGRAAGRERCRLRVGGYRYARSSGTSSRRGLWHQLDATHRDGRPGKVLVRQMRITRLGEQVDATRRLSSAAIDRTASVLRDYRRSMDQYDVSRARVVATSAARDAVNADQFMSIAEEITGVQPEVLSGEEEGRLSFVGATTHLAPLLTGIWPLLVVDVGGGSTEIAVGRPGSPDGARALQVVARSLDIGCVRVSERFRHDPPSNEDVAAARRRGTEEVVSARATCPGRRPTALWSGWRVPCPRWSVSTAALLLTIVTRSISPSSRDDVERWLGILSSEDARARLARPGMTPGREDVIVGGVLCSRW